MIIFQRRRHSPTPLLDLIRKVETSHCRDCNEPIAWRDRQAAVDGHGMCFECWKDEH